MAVSATSFTEAMKLGSETYHTLKGILKKKYGLDSTPVGDEGGVAPALQDPQEALELLMMAIESAIGDSSGAHWYICYDFDHVIRPCKLKLCFPWYEIAMNSA